MTPDTQVGRRPYSGISNHELSTEGGIDIYNPKGRTPLIEKQADGAIVPVVGAKDVILPHKIFSKRVPGWSLRVDSQMGELELRYREEEQGESLFEKVWGLQEVLGRWYVKPLEKGDETLPLDENVGITVVPVRRKPVRGGREGGVIVVSNRVLKQEGAR